MLATLVAAALTTATLGTQPDTTIAVRPGIRLEVENFGGDIVVKTWDKDAVKIAADRAVHEKIEIARSGSALIVRNASGGSKRMMRRWVPGNVSYRITAPRWMDLELSGVNCDIAVENSKGEVRGETVNGDISVTGGARLVSVSSVTGEITVREAEARIEAASVNQDVRLLRVRGPIAAESVNGSIVLEQVDADSVDASTMNGCVVYEGAFREGGLYRLSSHNGLIDVAVPERAGIDVSVSTFSGGFDSDIPLVLQRSKRGRHLSFTLGSGKARVELQSFQGTIHLRRPGEARAGCDQDEGRGENAEEGHGYGIEVHGPDEAEDSTE